MLDYIVFDTETTGLSPIANEIVEIGAWKISQGVTACKFSQLVRPKGYYGRDVQQITGITLDMLSDAPEIEEVLPAFIDFCGDLPLLGHSLSFDYDFICNKARPLGYDFSLKKQRTGIDTLSLCRSYYKGVSHKLSDMASTMGIQLKADNLQFHRAEYDAYITKLIYDRFLAIAADTNELLRSDIEIPKLLDTVDGKYGRAVNNGTLNFG